MQGLKYFRKAQYRRPVWILIFGLLAAATAAAHRSGCHRWHSCPSDSGSYVCGDTGHCNGCPDNRYCKDGKPRTDRDGASDGDGRTDRKDRNSQVPPGS